MADEPLTKEALLARIHNRWQALHSLLGRLSAPEKEQPIGDGWSAKVHRAHLTAWETSLLALLQRKNRGDEMGIPRDVWDEHDTDAINQIIAERSVARPLSEIEAESEQVHAELLAHLQGMSQEDLEKPYSHYQPDAADRDQVVVGWVHGNTWDHYDEHIGWLEQGLSAR